MSKQALHILFGSEARVKILKFLMRNQDRGFSVEDIANHTQEKNDTVRQEIRRLLEAKVIRKTTRSHDSKEKNKPQA